MTTSADYQQCSTTAFKCTVSTSCCTLAFESVSTPAQASVCFPAGTKTTAAVKAVTASPSSITALKPIASGKSARPGSDCAAATGASTIVASAAAVATAVYMM